MKLVSRNPWIGVLLSLATSALSAQDDNLTEVFAKARAQQIAHLNYSLSFELEKGSKTYVGRTTADFELVDATPDLVVDFFGESVTDLSIDGKKIEDFRFEPKAGKITVPAAHLSKGQTRLSIDYVGLYSHTGQGFHQFFDPSDGHEYLYTHFEPNDAHRMFPCFDQPDIKATFRVDVLAPADWLVVGNGAPKSKQREGDRVRTTLKKTLPFSTYIYQLTAGPYAVWRDSDFRYPLALYSRQSLANAVDADRFLEATRKSFDFFDAYFDYPYPFEKYDQVFAPEFNIGAMENVATVTFNEYYIYHGKPTRQQLIRRDLTLFHEMAHMWFGDLVTMKWWNDTWLKESFATYMSYLAMEGTGVADVWTQSARSKDSAMTADQKITTHPILATVGNVREAASIFDGITYGKGFSALRQLDYYLGGTHFRDGCRRYFKEHAFGNTTLDDFISSLEQASSRSLDNWVEQWLGTEDVNSVQIAYSSKDGRMTDSEILQQSGRANKVLRVHAADLALFYLNDDGLARPSKVIRIDFKGAKTALPQLNGLKAPLFMLPNYSDHDYVKVRLDPMSLAWIRENLDKIQDLQTQTTVWRILRDMVRDAQISAKVYLELGLKQAPVEKQPQVLARVLNYMGTIIDAHIVDEGERSSWRTAMFDLARTQIDKQAEGSDSQVAWYNALINSAEADSDLELLIEILEGTRVYKGLDITNQRKWRILSKLTGLGHKRAGALAEAMSKKDSSDSGKNSLLLLAALKPNAEAKIQAWQKVTEGKYSLRETFTIAGGIYANPRLALLDPYIDRFFTFLPKAWSEREYIYVKRYVNGLFPHFGHERTLKAAETFLKRDDLDPTLRKLILGHVDTLQRTRAIRNAWSGVKMDKG